jgi:hypothetical protein
MDVEVLRGKVVLVEEVTRPGDGRRLADTGVAPVNEEAVTQGGFRSALSGNQ